MEKEAVLEAKTEEKEQAEQDKAEELEEQLRTQEVHKASVQLLYTELEVWIFCLLLFSSQEMLTALLTDSPCAAHEHRAAGDQGSPGARRARRCPLAVPRTGGRIRSARFFAN